jgi:hypothetical protein
MNLNVISGRKWPGADVGDQGRDLAHGPVNIFNLDGPAGRDIDLPAQFLPSQ